jgi:outer membrane autotransporter protein
MPTLLLGGGVGFSSGSQWADGFSGRGATDSYQASLYASFTRDSLWLDGLAGYAWNDNRMTRQIAIPGLSPRTANGATGANQLFGRSRPATASAFTHPLPRRSPPSHESRALQQCRTASRRAARSRLT